MAVGAPYSQVNRDYLGLVSVYEKVEQVTSTQVTATLSAVSTEDVVITLAVDGTAVAEGEGADYTLSSNTITIPAGQTSGSVTVTTISDSAVDANETVVFSIETVDGAELSTENVTITIR